MSQLVHKQENPAWFRTGHHPMAIASAYVIAQKFPVFALVGPATLEESARTCAALDITLTDEEIKWSNLEDYFSDLALLA